VRDVSEKPTTLRTAIAEAIVRLTKETLRRIRSNDIPKGDPLPVANVAAIQAAKNTSQILPYCHPLPIEWVNCEFELTDDPPHIRVRATVKAIAKTGVEMEALTAASVAALTLYDMLKMIDESLEIVSVRLLEKKGGKSDFKQPTAQKIRAGILVMSDSVSSGKSIDQSGVLMKERLEKEGIEVVESKVIADELDQIENTLLEYTDTKKLDLVLTTGGTGLGPRDHTPEATSKVIDRELQGVAEALRSYGQERMGFSMLSRGKAGIRGKTIIVNLPGSPRAVEEGMNVLFPWLKHSFTMIAGKRHDEE
jgi:cyclic pyranopterin phosphate synthase